MLNTTFRKLKEAGACISSYRKLAKALFSVRTYGRDTLIPLDKILEVCGFKDTLWSLRATVEDSDKFNRLLACDYAEHVLHIYEERYPDDNRPRTAIDVARRYANGEATKEELEIASAIAWSATRTTAGDVVASGAANAASAAAASGAANAASAASDAASAASDAAWSAVRAANVAAEEEWQRQRLSEMLIGIDNG